MIQPELEKYVGVKDGVTYSELGNNTHLLCIYVGRGYFVRENVIENYLVFKFPGLCYKFTSPGRVGVPDRICIYNNRIWFVELKRPGGKLRKIQEKVIKDIRNQGAEVLVFDNKEDIDKWIYTITRKGL